MVRLIEVICSTKAALIYLMGIAFSLLLITPFQQLKVFAFFVLAAVTIYFFFQYPFRKLYVFIFSTLLLFISINFFEISFAEVRNFESFSDNIVKDHVSQSVEHGVFLFGGEILGRWQQFYLQFKLLGLFAPNNAELLPVYFYWIRTILGFFTALTLALFVIAVRREFGKWSALSALLGLMFSPWLVNFSMSIYWFIFASLLPFAFSFMWYEKFRSSKKRMLLWFFFLGFLVFLKSLLGYEHLTNIALSVAIPVVYYEMKNSSSFRRIIFRSVVSFAAACVGFVFAFLLNLFQNVKYFGSFQDGLSKTLENSYGRTFGDVLGNQVSLSQDIMIFIDYLLQPAFTIQQVLSISHLFIIVSTVGLGYVFVSQTRTEESKRIVVLLVLALISTLSWGVFGKGHMRYHLHLNSIIFYMPFHLLAFAALPLFIHRMLKKQAVEVNGENNISKNHSIILVFLMVFLVVYSVVGKVNDFQKQFPNVDKLTSISEEAVNFKLTDELLIKDVKLSSKGANHYDINIIVQVTDEVKEGFVFYMHAFPFSEDILKLPENRQEYGYDNWDITPNIPTNEWMVGNEYVLTKTVSTQVVKYKELVMGLYNPKDNLQYGIKLTLTDVNFTERSGQ